MLCGRDLLDGNAKIKVEGPSQPKMEMEMKWR
jgi:hypothetical protein